MPITHFAFGRTAITHDSPSDIGTTITNIIIGAII